MTRLSEYLLPTEREAPADAEALSHRLMVRAGLVRQLGAGLWTWLPAGWRVHRKIEALIRAEMEAIGAQEVLMPVLGPAEPWRRTGRYDIPELFKLRDRREAELVLAMTHEEIVTYHAAQLIRSYRDLPLSLYHFQVKERDEPRPRAGVLRTREFIMKDAYSFDRDEAGMNSTYERFVGAYDRIMERTGLRWYRVQSDVGMMGGLGAHEYMAPCAAGENEIALAPGYAANVEVASAQARPASPDAERAAPEEVSTPGLTRVEEVAQLLGVHPSALLKAYPVVRAAAGEGALEGPALWLALVRGDHRVNEVKLARALGGPVRPARPEEIEAQIGPVGFIGPVDPRSGDVRIVLDQAVPAGCYVTGANRPGAHLRGVRPGRDFQHISADIRMVQEGDTVAGHPIVIERAIEVANIFKLGVRYSTPLEASYLDEDGRAKPLWMASYGIGPARIAAAAVEQLADERGISWPRALAPFAIHLVSLGRPGSEERAAAEDLYERICASEALRAEHIDVLYDDRDLGTGEKLTVAELLGCPLRLTVGRRALQRGEVEVQVRRGLLEGAPLPLSLEGEELVRALRERWQEAP
ncbi:MAG TPA: proline--tRNA ligase [Solirubrobacteraceae bacterium]|nr:proline--tRNA ligase [Solirubrobacteraceae bacterium]